MMNEFIKNKLLKIFLVFLAIILGSLLTTSIRLILDKKEDVPKEQKEPEKNYYIYYMLNFIYVLTVFDFSTSHRTTKLVLEYW